MTHGDSNPLQELRKVRLMMAAKTFATYFVLALLLGVIVYGPLFAFVGVSVSTWLLGTLVLVTAFVAGNVAMLRKHKEVFGL